MTLASRLPLLAAFGRRLSPGTIWCAIATTAVAASCWIYFGFVVGSGSYWILLWEADSLVISAAAFFCWVFWYDSRQERRSA